MFNDHLVAIIMNDYYTLCTFHLDLHIDKSQSTVSCDCWSAPWATGVDTVFICEYRWILALEHEEKKDLMS